MLAQQSIKIAVAWFNSKDILNILCWKMKAGVKVEIVLHYDDINANSDSSLNFLEFKQLGSTLIWAKGEKTTMHVKFCIIDERIILHGSCNWTYRAFKKNVEVLNVTTDEPQMLNTYLSNFASIKDKFTSTVNSASSNGFTPISKKKATSQYKVNVEKYEPLSVEHKKQLFLQALHPFESEYEKDYLQTFVEYWLAENMGRLRIEIGEDGRQMNLLGITPEYIDTILGQWKRKYGTSNLCRIDIHCEIQAVPFSELSKMQHGEPSATIRERVIAARKILEERFKSCKGIHSNAMMTERMLHEYAEPDAQSFDMLCMAMERLKFSVRAYSRILKIARTIADLAGSKKVQSIHIAEAIGYRNLDRGDWAERGHI